MSKGWLITGVSSGIGRLLAEQALLRGDRVVGTVRQSVHAEEFEALCEGRAVARIVDVTDEANLNAVVLEAEKILGGIDILINNAGVGLDGSFEEITSLEFRACLETNLFGTVSAIRAALPGMRNRLKGDIINIGSGAGLIGLPGLSAYSTAKFAIEGLTEALAAEVRPFGLRVMVVEPGGFRTGFGGSIAIAANTIEAYDATPGRSKRDIWHDYDANQPGDPKKLVDAILKIIEEPELPIRLIVGKYLYNLVDQKLKKFSQDMEYYKDISYSAESD